MDRGYREKIIEGAFNKVRSLSRLDTLKKVSKETTDKLTLVITYDPRLPSIPSVVHKHARTLLMDAEMRQTFSDGFQVGFKRYRNLKEFICRSKLYDVAGLSRRNEPRAVTKGWKKCNKCTACSRSANMSSFKSSATGESFQISDIITCKESPILYIIECTKCHNKPQYVGKSTRNLMTRGREHISNVDKGNFENIAFAGSGKMYQHFTSNNHSSHDMKIYGIEVVHGEPATCTVRERFWMNKLDTIRYGLNTYRT